MSIFSSIRRSRQQAKEHRSKLADQKKKEEEGVKEPYRHVPTHAAADAFASAPPSWRETADRPRIIEENRRRSAMAAAAGGHHQLMNLPSVPRIGSSLSYMSYPGPQSNGRGSSASSVIGGVPGGGPSRMRLPRTYSTGGISPYPGGSRDIIYSIPDVSHPDDYPASQDTGSSSSQDDLEMPRIVSRPPVVTGGGRPHVAPVAPVAPGINTTVATPPSKVHRLHPSSRSRRTSDASVVDRPSPAAAAAVADTTPAIPTSPVRQDSWLPVHKPRVSSLRYAGARSSVAAATALPSDANAIVSDFPTASRATAHADALRALEATAPSRPPRFIGVEAASSTSSSTSSSNSGRDDVNQTKGEEPAVPVPQAIINTFPEPASDLREPSPPAKTRSKKLTKGGGKLLKKNR